MKELAALSIVVSSRVFFSAFEYSVHFSLFPMSDWLNADMKRAIWKLSGTVADRR